MFFAKDLDISNMHQEQVHNTVNVLVVSKLISRHQGTKMCKVFIDELTLRAIFEQHFNYLQCVCEFIRPSHILFCNIESYIVVGVAG